MITKFLSRFGFIPRQAVAELQTQRLVDKALLQELNERLQRLEERLDQAVSAKTEVEVKHKALSEKHEQLQRCVPKLTQALSGRAMAGLNGSISK